MGNVTVSMKMSPQQAGKLYMHRERLVEEVAELKETMQQIVATEESYDDEQTVLGEIYDKCRAHLET